MRYFNPNRDAIAFAEEPATLRFLWTRVRAVPAPGLSPLPSAASETTTGAQR